MKLLSILMGLLLFAVGITKVAGMKFQRSEFQYFNLPPWMMYVIGIIETTSGILICLNSTTYLGLILASLVLCGVTIALWIGDERSRSFLPFVLMMLSLSLLWDLAPGTPTTFFIFSFLGILLLLSTVMWFGSPTSMNRHGEREKIAKNCIVTHRFEETLGIRYHYVTAGEQHNSTVVMVHGFAESWYSFHHQIAALSEKYFVVALDLKPYGQTGKDLNGDHSFSRIAEEIKTLLDKIGVDKFHLIGRDRGAIASDNLIAKKRMQERIISFIRMQQSFNKPHGKPEPPHKIMASYLGTLFYRLKFSMWLVYKISAYTTLSIPSKVVSRIEKEFKFKNIALAVPLSFKTTSFAKELKDRYDFIFDCMTMPVLILQGRFDPGQHPEEYELSHTAIHNCEVKFVDAGHFLHLEAPKETNEIILEFLAKYTQKKMTRTAATAKELI